MLDGRIARQTEWPDLNAVLTFVALAFSAVTTVLLIWMFFKIRRLSAALMLVQQIQQIKSLPTEVPSFIDKRSTQATTQDYFDFDITLSWEHANLIFLLINTILLITFIIRHKKISPDNFGSNKQKTMCFCSNHEIAFVSFTLSDYCSYHYFGTPYHRALVCSKTSS